MYMCTYIICVYTSSVCIAILCLTQVTHFTATQVIHSTATHVTQYTATLEHKHTSALISEIFCRLCNDQ